MRIGFPFFPINVPACCSPLMKLLPPFEAVVCLADFPSFRGEPFVSSPLSLLDFFGIVFTSDCVVVLADAGIDRLGFTSNPSTPDALLCISYYTYD